MESQLWKGPSWETLEARISCLDRILSRTWFSLSMAKSHRSSVRSSSYPLGL